MVDAVIVGMSTAVIAKPHDVCYFGPRRCRERLLEFLANLRVCAVLVWQHSKFAIWFHIELDRLVDGYA